MGVDAAGIIRYVGITSRDATVRWAEHAIADPAKALLQWAEAPSARFATKLEARIWEQSRINDYGLAKSGGDLLNKINSIATKYWTGLGIK